MATPVSLKLDGEAPSYLKGRYEILDLLKLQFSKLSKKERPKYFGLLERPKVEFRTEARFDPSITNREFRRRWSRAGKGPFHADKMPRYTVFTARPGPGPLVKAEKFLRKQEYKLALRQHRQSRGTRDRFGPAAGPLPPYRSSFQGTGKRPERGFTVSKTNTGRKKPDRVLVQTHSTPNQSGVYTSLVGGKTVEDMTFTTPPPGHWKKYWYFYRTRGYWRVSEHHPYGDEEPVITDWLIRNGQT